MITFTTNTILPILEKELIGKVVKVCVSSKPIWETYTIEVKKSESVTDKQFLSGDKKYRMPSTKRRKIGVNEVFENSPIKRLFFERTDNYRYPEYMLRAELDNGCIIDLED